MESGPFMNRLCISTSNSARHWHPWGACTSVARDETHGVAGLLVLFQMFLCSFNPSYHHRGTYSRAESVRCQLGCPASPELLRPYDTGKDLYNEFQFSGEPAIARRGRRRNGGLAEWHKRCYVIFLSRISLSFRN